MYFAAVLGLAVAQPAEVPVTFQHVQCPDIAMVAGSGRKVKLVASELEGWNGPLIQLFAAVTTDEIQRFGKLSFIRLGGKPFAGGLLGRQLDESGETHFVLSFNGDILPVLTSGGSLELIEKDGPGLTIQLLPADATPMANCFAANPRPSDPATAPYFPRRTSFVATEPNQLLQVRSRGNLEMAYPGSALSEGREGVARVRFVIGTSGRIERCEVTVGSGYADLDVAACRAVKMISYFPTTNAAGEPVETEREQLVEWKIPK